MRTMMAKVTRRKKKNNGRSLLDHNLPCNPSISTPFRGAWQWRAAAQCTTTLPGLAHTKQCRVPGRMRYGPHIRLSRAVASEKKGSPQGEA